MTSDSTPFRGFAELTLETRDLGAMRRFYAGALGLPVRAEEDDRIWLGVGEEARLGLWRPGEKEHGDRGGAHVHFAFRLGDGGLDAVRERLGRAGCPCELTEHEGGDRSVYLEDPEGNVVELWDHAHPGRIGG
jgi:catechol-2,3-dioxygenase